MKKTYKFIIPGDPHHFYRKDHKYAMTIPYYAERHIKCYTILDNQFDNEKIIDYPIDVDVKFYMYDILDNESVVVSVMFRILNKIAKGLIYKKDSLINNLTLTKYYVREPRVEMIIKPSRPFRKKNDKKRKKQKQKN